MTIINIDEIVALTTSDNQPMTYIKGKNIQSNCELGVQPTSVTYPEAGNPNMEEAQAVYLELLKDKLARGYDMDKSSPKLKINS